MWNSNTLMDAAATATALNFIGFNVATLEPHLRPFGLSPLSTGLVFVLTGAVYALTSPIMGKLCESQVRFSAVRCAIFVSTISRIFSFFLDDAMLMDCSG